MARPIYEIAQEINALIKGKPFEVYAKAYTVPMLSLTKITDTYGFDTADTVIAYALSNLTGWRGEDAKRIKAELKDLIK